MSYRAGEENRAAGLPDIQNILPDGLMTLPFSSKTTFLAIMKGCHLPNTLLGMIAKGKAHFPACLIVLERRIRDGKVRYDIQDRPFLAGTGVPGCVMPIAKYSTNTKPLVIDLSWNIKKKVTNAMLLGCDDEDINEIRESLTHSIQATGHPLLLLALFANLQLNSLDLELDPSQLVRIEPSVVICFIWSLGSIPSSKK
jgi:hypothetical protein